MTAKKRTTQEDQILDLQLQLWNLKVRVGELEHLVDELDRRYKFVAYPWLDNRGTFERGETDVRL